MTEPTSPDTPVAPIVDIVPIPPAEPEDDPPFEFTDDRKFDLYMEQRKGYVQGARDAYQRFDQTIVALSVGSIVLSISFMKDIGHLPQSLPWLLSAWGCFLIASLCAFISLLTSGEADRERISQIDCQVETGACDETKAQRLGHLTTRLNYLALTMCIVGMFLIIVFAIYNLLNNGVGQWQKSENTSTSPATSANPVHPPTQHPENARSKRPSL